MWISICNRVPFYKKGWIVGAANYIFPTTNDIGATTPASLAGQLFHAAFNLVAAPTCPTSICPLFTPRGATAPVPVYLSQVRGIFSTRQAFTGQSYLQAYVNDDWTINNRVTLNGGMHWTKSS